jgi:hypothetical protein
MPTVLSGYGFAASNGPHLVLDDIGTSPTTRTHLPVRDFPITLTATEQRRCTGYFDVITYDSVPCPDQNRIGPDVETCFPCFRRTGFNPSFYNMPLEGVSPQQRAYNEREHVVYLAYFGADCIKVGISSRDRVLLRLRGQGARLAMLIASTADAYQARGIEESIVKKAGLPETVRSARKRSLINEPLDPERARRSLEETRALVEKACELHATPLSVHDFTSDYLARHTLDFPVTDLSDERPPSISGTGLGLIGDVLLVAESGRQFMLSLKEVLGCVVHIEPTVRRNSRRPASGQLGFGFS